MDFEEKKKIRCEEGNLKKKKKNYMWGNTRGAHLTLWGRRVILPPPYATFKNLTNALCMDCTICIDYTLHNGYTLYKRYTLNNSYILHKHYIMHKHCTLHNN